jgi:putative Mn2+ efflux pump MntP
MGLATTFLIALGLSADAFAVAVSDGAQTLRITFRHALSVALAFGVFQAVMPVIGWVAGRGFADAFAAVDHWIAFGLLGVIGARMIYADLRPGPPEAPVPRGATTLLVLAVATSIDALAVGFGLAFVDTILIPVLIIGVVTFTVCFAGVYLGHRYRHLARGKVQLVGGVILIAIGTKILLEHLGVLGAW